MVVDSLISVLGGSGDPPFSCYPVRTVKKAHMPVNLEVKGSLAKCLATENLIVEHKKVSTASFDVDRRVLTLPMWDRASATVYDLLVGHEVGHALFTDNIDWREEYPDLPKDFVNVIEDVRVERLMKKKYPGLSRTFYNGYNELNTQDFFCTDGEDLNNLSFIDRINLYFKIGAFHNIAFSDDENEFVTRISAVDTFQEVLQVTQEIVDFLNYKKKKLSEMPEMSQDQGQVGGEEVELPEQQQGNSESSDPLDLEQQSQGSSSTEQESQGDESVTMDQDTPSGGGAQPSKEHGEFESKTAQSFEEKAEELTNKFGEETTYAELPEIKLENVIIPNEYIHNRTQEYYTDSSFWVKDWHSQVISEYVKYKKSAEKEVSYLMKEFECKKSANQYARSSTARTGVLDTSKLHTYKYNEDLFKKVSVVPDGKNHGLIFILDWSGSMARWILDTCKQMYNLIWFCKKANIPFEVYAFTVDPNSYVEVQPDHPPLFDKVDGLVAPEKSFRLMNFFSSKSSARQLEEQMKNIWAVCWAFQNSSGATPRHLDLSGSPLGDTMLTLHSLIPDFQKKNQLQKVNVVFLTDGEGYVNSVTTLRKSKYGEEYVGYSRAYKTTIRNRKNGRIYQSYSYGNFPQYSKVLLSTLKDKFPTVNFINFRIVPSRDFKTCYDWYGVENGDYESVKKNFKKNQYITFTGTGYDQFNVLPATALAQDEDFVVPEDASKAQIKTAFVKMLSKKKTNKKLLSSFIDTIA